MYKNKKFLKYETIAGIAIKQNGTYVDCTVGGGGHSLEIVSQLNEEGKLIAFDQDMDALKAAKEKLSAYADKIIFVNKNFKHLQEELEKRDITHVEGDLFDLGFISHNLV